MKTETQPAISVPLGNTKVTPPLVSTSSPQVAKSPISLLLNRDNYAEGSLTTLSGSASTGYFMQLEGEQSLNLVGSQEGLKERKYLRDEGNIMGPLSSSNSEEESVEEESAEEMTSMAQAIKAPITSMANAMNAPVDITPFSLEVDSHCTVELLTFDQESRMAKIMSVEEGVGETLESLLRECAESGGLEEIPPSVGQLVAVLGPTGAYIRAKIMGVKASSKQVRFL